MNNTSFIWLVDNVGLPSAMTAIFDRAALHANVTAAALQRQGQTPKTKPQSKRRKTLG